MGTSIHSDKSSKGIIMALGNIGRFLDISIINTYLSIDGVKMKYIRDQHFKK